MLANAPKLPIRPAPRGAAHLNRQRGFTILEVTLAGFVLVFGICSAMLTLKGGFNAIDAARDTTLAAQIIQSEMERVRLLPWDTTSRIPNSGTPGTLKPAIVRLNSSGNATETIEISSLFPTDTESAKIVGKEGKQYTITRTVADVPNRDSTMKSVTVTVTWISNDGARRTRKSSTYYSKSGLYDYYYTTAGGT